MNWRMVAQNLGSQRLVGFDMALHWALRTVNHLAVLRCLMHLSDMLLDSMKSSNDYSTQNCRLGHKDHSFAAGKQHSTIHCGCSSLDLESMGNLP